MNEKLVRYLDGVFSPYEGTHSINELKEELLNDLQEKLSDYKNQGYDDETAFEMTIDGIGDIEQTVQEVANLSRSLERQVLTNFSATTCQRAISRVLPRIKENLSPSLTLRVRASTKPFLYAPNSASQS